jgi:hypothetical protein
MLGSLASRLQAAKIRPFVAACEARDLFTVRALLE